MKKTTTILATLALALSLGVSFAPLALASGEVLQTDLGVGNDLPRGSEMTANAIHPLMQFTRVEPENSYLGLVFNPENSQDYTIKRLVIAAYRYDSYTQTEVEQSVELLKLQERPSWAELWFNDDISVAAGVYREDNLAVGEWIYGYQMGVLNNNPGLVYYMVEYDNRGETDWIFGKLDYRSCTQVRNDGFATEFTPCLIFSDDDNATWRYVREDSEITDAVDTWEEELARRAIKWLENIEIEVDFFTPENTESEQQRLYQALLTVRSAIKDTTPELYEQIMLRSRNTYKMIFGIYEDGYDPNAPKEDLDDEPKGDSGDGVKENPDDGPKEEPDNESKEDPKGDPDPENPELENPEPEKPEIENPELEKPEIEKPEIENPGPEKPGPINPGSDTPVVPDVPVIIKPGNSSSERPISFSDNSQLGVVDGVGVMVNTTFDGNATENLLATRGEDLQTISQSRGEGAANSVKDGVTEMQVPVLSEDKEAVLPVKKPWTWPFWIMIAGGLGLLGWLVARWYKRYHH